MGIWDLPIYSKIFYVIYLALVIAIVTVATVLSLSVKAITIPLLFSLNPLTSHNLMLFKVLSLPSCCPLSSMW